MSHYSVPSWNLRQEHAEEEERINRSSHVQNHQTPSCVVPMSIHEVPDLAWENGLQAMHGLNAISFPTPTTKPSWDKNGDHTLESILHQATYHKPNTNSQQHHPNEANGSSRKWGERTDHTQMDSSNLLKKRTRSDSDKCGRYFYSNDIQEELHDTSMTTWPSSDSLRSVKTKTTAEDNCAHHEGLENKNEVIQIDGEGVRSLLTRNSRAAAIHNQSERRRRDRINQKLKALQKLVPNASKTDKASMLDEIIKYLKQLQTQVQVMSVTSIPQMGMALGMQQQIQMSIMARMGMGVGLGMGMGMLNLNNIARSAQHQPLPSFVHPGAMAGATPTFMPPPFFMQPAIPTRPTDRSIIGGTPNNSIPYNDPYGAFLAHSMNMELYNKMAALIRHQISQQTSDNSSQANLVQPQ